MVELLDGELREYAVTPEEVGLVRRSPDAVPSGDPAANAAITTAILAGEDGAARDMAVLNAGAAILAAGRAPSLREGVTAAQVAIDSGAAAATLAALVARTRELAPS